MNNLKAVEMKLESISNPDPALAELARTLARTLDEGAGMAVAAVSRELRATLAALAPPEGEDDGPMDEWTDLSG